MDPVPRSRGHHLIAGEDGLADDHRTDVVAHEVDRFVIGLLKSPLDPVRQTFREVLQPNAQKEEVPVILEREEVGPTEGLHILGEEPR